MLAHTRGCVCYTSTRILEIAGSIVLYGPDMSWLSMNINGIPTWISDRFYEPDWTCVSAARYMVNNGSNNHRASHSVVPASHQITSHHITSHIELSVCVCACLCAYGNVILWKSAPTPQNAKKMETVLPDPVVTTAFQEKLGAVQEARNLGQDVRFPVNPGELFVLQGF